MTNPLQVDLADLKERLWAAEQARTEPWNCCENEALTAQFAEIIARMADANRRVGVMRADIDRHRSLAPTDRKHAHRLVFDSHSENLRKRADEHDAEMACPRAQLKAVQKESAALQKQESAIRDEMVVP